MNFGPDLSNTASPLEESGMQPQTDLTTQALSQTFSAPTMVWFLVHNVKNNTHNRLQINNLTGNLVMYAAL